MSTNSPVHKTYNSILDKHCLSTLPFKMLDNRDQFHFVLLVLISNTSITKLGSLAHCLLRCRGLGVRGWKLGLCASVLALPMDPLYVTASLPRIRYKTYEG